jgi:hypothetical protein
MTSRNFTASLKPAWTKEQIMFFLKKMTGSATIYIINHDKDTDSNGEPVPNHTHVLIQYETPRKITTVANLLNVQDNFVETVKSFSAMLRYLTHKDDNEKFQYQDSEVLTNHHTSYENTILGQSMSNQDIFKAITDGKALQILDIVSPSKIRTIQAIAQYDKSSSIHQEIKLLNDRFNESIAFMVDLRTVVYDYIERSVQDQHRAVEALHIIADALNKRLSSPSTKGRQPKRVF